MNRVDRDRRGGGRAQRPLTWGPFFGVASVYILLCSIVGLYAFVRGGAGPDDLFPGVAYVALTLPTSLLGARWPALMPVLIVTSPIINVTIAALVCSALARRRRM